MFLSLVPAAQQKQVSLEFREADVHRDTEETENTIQTTPHASKIFLLGETKFAQNTSDCKSPLLALVLLIE